MHQGLQRHDRKECPKKIRRKELLGAPPVDPLSLARAMREIPRHQEEKEDETAVVKKIRNVGRETVVAVAMPHDDAEGRVDAAEVNPCDALLGHGAGAGRDARGGDNGSDAFARSILVLFVILFVVYLEGAAHFAREEGTHDESVEEVTEEEDCRGNPREADE